MLLQKSQSIVPHVGIFLCSRHEPQSHRQIPATMVKSDDETTFLVQGSLLFSFRFGLL